MEKLKQIKLTKKHLHIALILLGMAFILLPAFHANIWFDESYSVAISNNHSFAEIWSIGGHDVHPVLYYWMLKIISLIFGNHMMIYHLFSVIAVTLLGILGYTHIRKDFGENTGILFTFFAFLFPVNVVYASEIRMYAWAMLFVTIMGIYAYRIFKGKSSAKNWIIFAIFSLFSAYTHYYGLMAAGIVNILLFAYLLKQAITQKKFTKDMRNFIIQGVIQILLYIPWIVSLLLQVSQVSKGFWIGIKFPDTLIEMFSFQFTGNLGDTLHIDNWLACVYGLIFTVYLIYLYIHNRKTQLLNKEERKPAKYAILVYGAVILGAAIVSLIIWRPIIYARYFLVVTGLFIFFLAYTMAKLGTPKLNMVMMTLTVLVALVVNINLIEVNYDASNQEPIQYVASHVQEGDIFVYGNEGSGFVISANFPQYQQYFYDGARWNVEEAYKAYGPNMKTVYNLNELENYTGRIWFINSNNYALQEEAMQKYPSIELIERKSFKTKYQKYQYSFAITEKKE